MIRVTLTNSKIREGIRLKKEDFYGSFSIFKEETYCIFTAKIFFKILQNIFVNAHKNHSGFIPQIIFTFIQNAILIFYTVPHWPVLRLKPCSARGCSEAKTSHLIKRHHCFSIFFSLRPAYHMTCR